MLNIFACLTNDPRCNGDLESKTKPSMIIYKCFFSNVFTFVFKSFIDKLLSSPSQLSVLDISLKQE